MLDLSAINISLPEAPDLSFGNLMSGIKIQASGDDVSNLAAALLKGYQEYAKDIRKQIIPVWVRTLLVI